MYKYVPTTCFGPFWLGHHQVGYTCWKNYITSQTSPSPTPRMTTQPQQRTVVTPPASDTIQYRETPGASTQSQRVTTRNGIYH